MTAASILVRIFLNYPSVNKERLQAFAMAVDSVMREGQDFMIIFEGKVKENRGVVMKCLEENTRHHREKTLIANKGDLDSVLKEGAPKKKRRVHRGFATAKSRENCFICGKRKVPGWPRSAGGMSRSDPEWRMT